MLRFIVANNGEADAENVLIKLPENAPSFMRLASRPTVRKIRVNDFVVVTVILGPTINSTDPLGLVPPITYLDYWPDPEPDASLATVSLTGRQVAENALSNVTAIIV